MEKQYSVKLGVLIDEFKLEVLREGEGCRETLIMAENINRPGLQLGGFFEYFDPNRLQLIGRVETTYMESFPPEKRREMYEGLLEKHIPALIFTRGIEPHPELLEMADKYDCTLLRTKETTAEFLSALVASLKTHLCPRVTRHGVLLEVYGEGILLMGESGVGKSETAIELVKRGHRLIADDAVEMKKVSNQSLVGSAPELIRHYIELRGIGIIDVRRLFGMSAVKDSQEVDLVINLEPWRDGVKYDRLGLDTQYTTILDVQIPALTIPVKPGRNLAVIIEVAAMNNRNNKMGNNAALEFTQQLDRYFDAAMGK